MGRFNDEVLENAIKAHGIGPLTTLDEVTIEFLKELQEYRRLEEQGLLVKLPCKVGGVVYCFWTTYNLETDEIETSIIKEMFEVAMIEDFGKTVFLTKAEAEKALAEMGCE